MDQVKIIFLGQSGFLIQKNSVSILIDPSKKKTGDVSGAVVIATHHHSDHTNGVETFLKRNPEAIFLCNEQVADRYEKLRERIVIAVPGEEFVKGTWKFKFVKGRHGLFSGVQNTGVIIRSESLIFGHAGDSVDFQGFSQEKMDYFAIPIGGIFTASPKRALKEIKSFSPPLPVIIPIHWLLRNPRGFCKRFTTLFPDDRCVVPKDGEIVTL